MTKLPLWGFAVLAALFVPMVAVQEPVFGSGTGLLAAGAGVGVGLVVALAATALRWDVLTTTAVTLAAYFLGAGPAALPETTIARVVPTWQTLTLAVTQAAASWRDLLTLSPPASSYTGPAILPWFTGLFFALAAGLLTVRAGRYLLGTLPIAAMGIVGIAWGTGAPAPLWPVAAWCAAVLAWWAWCGERRRISRGQAILVGRKAAVRLDTGSAEHTHVAVVHRGRRIVSALLTLAVAGAAVLPVVDAWGAFDERRVLRDVVVPPLNVQELPTPLASFRYYIEGAKTDTLIRVTGLPKDARMRLAVMDTYNGIVFGMSNASDSPGGGYRKAGRVLRPAPGAGAPAVLEVSVNGLKGVWVPTAGEPEAVVFSGDNADALQAGLYFDQWSNAALSTAFTGSASYEVRTTIAPKLEDSQIEGLNTPSSAGTPDERVPAGIADYAQRVTASARSQFDRVSAIETALKKGLYWNKDEDKSRSGHRAERLQAMLGEDQMVGDDEQYAALMALMLHSLDIPARVVMGAYPADGAGGSVSLTGNDFHVWVEVPFESVGWVPFDPTPKQDQVPRTKTNDPRPTPQPQVLQPPDPPQDPVELPPSVTDRPNNLPPADSTPIPWGLVAGVSGGVLVLLGPLVVIALLKVFRRRRRRAAPPAAAVSGSWAETVDLAVDAGVDVPPNLTRREASWMLSAQLWGDPGGGQPTTWLAATEQAPRVVSLAQQADMADFGPDESSPAAARVPRPHPSD